MSFPLNESLITVMGSGSTDSLKRVDSLERFVRVCIPQAVPSKPKRKGEWESVCIKREGRGVCSLTHTRRRFLLDNSLTLAG